MLLPRALQWIPGVLMKWLNFQGPSWSDLGSLTPCSFPCILHTSSTGGLDPCPTTLTPTSGPLHMLFPLTWKCLLSYYHSYPTHSTPPSSLQFIY